jgi:hypothetical protein
MFQQGTETRRWGREGPGGVMLWQHDLWQIFLGKLNLCWDLCVQETSLGGRAVQNSKRKGLEFGTSCHESARFHHFSRSWYTLYTIIVHSSCLGAVEWEKCKLLNSALIRDSKFTLNLHNFWYWCNEQLCATVLLCLLLCKSSQRWCYCSKEYKDFIVIGIYCHMDYWERLGQFTLLAVYDFSCFITVLGVRVKMCVLIQCTWKCNFKVALVTLVTIFLSSGES